MAPAAVIGANSNNINILSTNNLFFLSLPSGIVYFSLSSPLSCVTDFTITDGSFVPELSVGIVMNVVFIIGYS